MSYRDDFYIKENIIGFTGNPAKAPTVYFKRDTTFGRITQEHKDKNNIGRSEVRTFNDYSITNNGNGVAEEFYNNEVQHTSRNSFVPVFNNPNGNNEVVDELAKAINKFTDLKSKY
jgi:hypothetical protein